MFVFMRKLMLFFLLCFNNLLVSAQSWTELGGTITGATLNANGFISSMCFDTSGNIYVGGTFVYSSGKYYVAKWDGDKWEVLGGTVPGIALNANGETITICSDRLGNIYTGGWFTDVNGKYYVAKWDGIKWSQVGGTTPGISLNATWGAKALSSDASGNIYAAGQFTNIIGNYNVAKWDGSKWTLLGGTVSGVTLNANADIASICSDNSGNIYAAGSFTDLNGYHYVAKWDGTKWTELGGTAPVVFPNVNSTIFSICSDASGNIYAGETQDDTGHNYVAKFGSTNSVTNIGSEKVVLGDISIFPNPTTGNLTVSTLESGQVNIYNSLGDIVVTQFVEFGNSSISLVGFGSGVYTVFFSGKSSNYSPPLKIIKE
jgi:hypothetical protein